MKRSRFLLLFLCLSMLNALQCKLHAQQVTFLTEINRLYNIAELPAYIDKSVVKQFSSYDRKGKNNDGFEGTYSFIRKNQDSSLVVFETKGKGVIERLWTPTPTDDTLDFYLDGNARPDFSIRFNDLFNGKIYPFISPLVGQHVVGGYYSYLPITYNKGCKIVFRGRKMLFYQFQYREYPDNYAVKTFNPKYITAEEDKKLNELVRLWKYENRNAQSFYGNNLESIPSVFNLNPGQSKTIADIKHGGRIVGMEFDPADAFEGLYKQIDMKITWDNDSKPAVYVPVADMFGYAFGKKSMKSLLLGVNYQNKAYCYLPMPFDRAAKVELVYRNGAPNAKPVSIQSRIYYTRQARNKEKEGKFYAYWKREEPAIGKPYTFLEGTGKGHYVGTVLHSQATDYTTFTEFFEGDDVTVIDGKMTIHGTGSEDYFNGGWYAQPGGWVERLGAELHGCLDYSLPLSRTGGYRFFVSDKMPFNKSIVHTIEHGPEDNNRAVDYISVAFYYADREIQNSMNISNTLTKVHRPKMFTFYTGLMDHLSYSGDMSLSNGKAGFKGTKATMSINAEEIPEGRYSIYVNNTGSLQGKIQVGIKQDNGEVRWTAIGNSKESDSIFIGNGAVGDTRTPITLFFKSDNGRIMFERVMLKPIL